MDTFATGDTARITGLTDDQLRRWDRTGLLPATVREGEGHGRRRRWSFADLVVLRSIRRLRDQNVSVQKISKAFRYLRRTYPELTDNLSGVVFIVYGLDVVALAPGEDFPVSTVRAQGQHVIRIPVDEVRAEVAEAICELEQAM